MLENLGLAVASFCILTGAFLLYDGLSSQGPSDLSRVIGGAASLSAGLITGWLVAKSKLAWWRINRRRGPGSAAPGSRPLVP